MKTITWSKFANVIFLVFIILGILIMLYSFFFMGFDVKAHEVPCYDRYSNVIQGQTCISDNPLDSEGGQLLIVGLFMFLGGLVLKILLRRVELDDEDLKKLNK